MIKMKILLLRIIAYGISITIIAFVHGLFFYVRDSLQYQESRQMGCKLFFHYYFYNGFLTSVFIYILYAGITAIMRRSSIHKKAVSLSFILFSLSFVYIIMLPIKPVSAFLIPFPLLIIGLVPAYLIKSIQKILFNLQKKP